MDHPFLRGALAPALLAVCAASPAHVVLPPGGAAGGSTYRAEFVVGHACSGSSSTTGLSVGLPAGFRFVSAEPRPGWSVETSADRVTWTASSPSSGLPGSAPAMFTIVGRLADEPTTLRFPAQQRCDKGVVDWNEPIDAAHPKPAYPAPHLDVLAPGVAAVDPRDAWAPPTLPGQTVASVFLRLTAPSGARLVGASSPIGHAEIHEMRMDGDVMRMRELPDGIDLPRGRPVVLTAATRHIMVTSLKAPMLLGAVLPLTLHFVDGDGRKGDLALQVPVARTPAGVDAAAEHHHEH